MTDELHYERRVDAPPDVVFHAFTAPAGQKAFYGLEEPGWIVESECDLRVGGLWAVSFGPARHLLYRHSHRIRVLDRPRRLVLDTTEFRLDGSTLDFVTEFTFAEQDGGRTLMTMIQTSLPTDELREEHARGLPNPFNLLQRHLPINQ